MEQSDQIVESGPRGTDRVWEVSQPGNSWTEGSYQETTRYAVGPFVRVQKCMRNGDVG